MSDDYAPREPVRDDMFSPFGNALGALLLLVSMPLFIYFAFSVPEPGETQAVTDPSLIHGALK